MKYEGLLFFPDGTKRDQFTLDEVKMPTGMEAGLIKFFRESFQKEGGFEDDVEFGNYGPPIQIHFDPEGKTAGRIVLGHNEGGKNVLDCVTALLTRLDADDDRKAVEPIRKMQWFKSFPPESFDRPLRHSSPLHATYFTSLESINRHAIHTVNRLMTAAFFGQFGVGVEE